jgi:hypothetical protein
MAEKMIDGFTLIEAKTQLGLWKECAQEIASGTAKHYRIGTREYTALDIDEVYRMIKYFAGIVDKLEGLARSRRVQVVVPRD